MCLKNINYVVSEGCKREVEGQETGGVLPWHH